MRQKNFKYGDLWEREEPLPDTGMRGEREVDPSLYTDSDAFSRYITENEYRLVISYDTSEAAYTLPTEKTIVLNGHLSHEMLKVLLQHELGHLMLFDVNQFATIRNDTIRSVVSEKVYTPELVDTYGLDQLMYLENVIQDVIIETVAENNCVCHQALVDLGENMGAKHLDSLENVRKIAEEAVANFRKTAVPETTPGTTSEEHREAMLDGLTADISEILEKLKELHTTEDFYTRRSSKRWGSINSAEKKLDKLRDKTLTPRNRARITKMIGILQRQLRELKSPEAEQRDRAAAEDARARAIANLERKLESRRALRKSFLNLVVVPNDDGEGEAEAEDVESDTPTITTNTTDHLGGDEDAPDSDSDVDNNHHSYDCGFPHPVRVDREASTKNEKHLKVVSGARPNVKKIFIDDDYDDDTASGRLKSTENEYTYFKPSKREFDATDMLKGRKRLRVSGINVLVGLDVSGSMTKEWSEQFVDISNAILSLQEKLDIENVVFFTYDHALKNHSRRLADLNLTPSGGNAFPYVYSQVVQTLPMMMRNEIILVTDCGDNLGFKLNDVAEISRQGTSVQNHISIIDTEGAGFYSKEQFNKEEWAIYSYGDPKLEDKIAEGIDDLIG